MKKTKVLITGIAGLIGANFARYLLSKGNYEVIGIDDLSGGYIENIPVGAVTYHVDCCDPYAFKVIQMNKPDYVFHFAAYAAEGLSPFIRNFNYRNNIIGSTNIINGCIEAEVKKIIFTSSMAVYGHAEPPFTETMNPSPADPYGIAKYAVELDLALAKEQFGLDYTIVRPHNVLGIYQNIWDRYRNVIGIWIRQVLNNEPLTIYGDGNQTRAFSDVKYIMEPFEKLMKPTEDIGPCVFNIGADKEYKIVDVANILVKVAKEHGYDASITHLEKRNEVENAYSDHERAKDALGFIDDTNLEELIREMFTWAKELKPQPVKKMDYEITKNIYSFWK